MDSLGKEPMACSKRSLPFPRNQGQNGVLGEGDGNGNQPMRRFQADLGARLDKLQMDVQNLTGRFEEVNTLPRKLSARPKPSRKATRKNRRARKTDSLFTEKPGEPGEELEAKGNQENNSLGWEEAEEEKPSPPPTSEAGAGQRADGSPKNTEKPEKKLLCLRRMKLIRKPMTYIPREYRRGERRIQEILKFIPSPNTLRTPLLAGRMLFCGEEV